MIEIFAVTYNGQPAAATVRGSFGPEGGTLGRSPDNRLALPDPARHVSRVQARVRYDGARYWIANASEANPLFLNDEEIESGKERPLVAGDELRVGLYVLRTRTPIGPSIDYRPASASAGSEPTLGAQAVVARSPMASPAPAPTPASIDAMLGAAGPAANPFADLLGGAAPLADAAHSASSAPADPLGVFASHPARAMPAAARAPVEPVAAPAAANPFADLLGAAPPARVPASALRPNNAPATAIPDDFNPFAVPASPSRNAADPLRDLANDGVDLASLSGEKRASLIDFQPSAKVEPGDALRGGTPSLVDPLHAVDPMQLFGGADDRLVAGAAAPRAQVGPMRDDFAELGANFTPPRALPDPRAPVAGGAAAGAGDRAAADAIAQQSTLLAGLVAPAAAPQPAAPPVVPARIVPPAAVPPAALAPPPPPAAPRPLGSLPTDAAPRPSDSTPHPSAPRLEPSPGIPTPPSAPASAALLAAFLEGAHAEALNVPNGLTPDMMRMLGRLVYHAVAGAMTLISARQITKREMGAEVTMIVPKGNNPLKFLPTPEAALMQILGPKMPGFMTSVDAMQDAFEDLRAHEVGVIAGTRAALSEVLRRFDPKVLEKRLGSGGMLDSVLPGGRRAKLWAAFEAQFNEVYREAEDDFNKLFGEAFITAYEAEVARHRGPR